MLQVKRIYEPYDEKDGFRILVDRLWPRGISKEKAHIDEWEKEIAPSNELREWFNHDPAKFAEFKTRYKHELQGKKDLLDAIRRKAQHQRVTLLYGAKDREHNQAQVLLEILKK
ncbi:Uncharacterized conserved protein YeaO, DUF488 family [Chitinophaga terrae (ex Kim and Jung 2007)]|jgi:uncharacterized protein YeaO (DUF488 family)|uniref:Uncharacterized conserved protein YeaO, DUF488 family n=1 Tax=Chitinophaga terrae (ex Kim and Jung 2007) TaxID=408074 RepID=A0A1H4E5U8_9BACT|nr:DUF488 domain-containing protein [Chitinophaga terrae (ex Kim and Jung 2007)]MDQ0108326.1 uncharacterized protein YeaO (DUF488 family) [Chitinophaga terrae (ex Kim and Jung 2007)]GEP91371.1 hypothetical protein CTE07_30160 [Chitinophaga terrae (ex Kim and Jung 2007)]SEA80393.1 Uncharacterized conserved protein YeaO, DUF488 family [Chitinophaga terrae (ex Kim and Jung 2007)]